jgi:8-oxo-dGTP pyrophosphatase MutT (NUDIX family)
LIGWQSDPMNFGWNALQAAQHRLVERVTLHVGPHADGRGVGSVARDHLDALRAWPQWVTLEHEAVTLRAEAGDRAAALADMNAALRDAGLIKAWRDETFALYAPASGNVLATFERAATRFWGTLTRGAHCNGFVRGTDGRPSHLWIARRSRTKATDPGMLDNLVGGGVPHGQTPHETMVREGWEEAGLDAVAMQAAQAGHVIRLDRDVPEGRMVEDVHVFDLELAAGITPRNQDGEVESIELLSVAEAVALAASDAMTVDAALVTLDFLLRHRLLPQEAHEQLAPRLAEMCRPA